MSGKATWVFESALNFVRAVGEVCFFFWHSLVATFTPPYDQSLLVTQIYVIGFRSISIVVVSSVAIGMVMVVQMAWGFAWFGAKGLVGPMVTLSFIRELGPIITSLLVGGRVGSGITAEISSMAVTEQIDAIKALGADPLKKLVSPRLMACIISFPLLAVISNLAGISGAMFISLLELEVGPTLFIESIRGWVSLEDLITGISKTFFFGIVVAITGCYVGMKTSGGTRGVGNATTKTVVISLFLIILLDFVLSKIFVLAVYDF